MADVFTTHHGVRAYDAARWLAPPPPEVRRIRRLPSGATCLVQVGAPRRQGVVQEALVEGRDAENVRLSALCARVRDAGDAGLITRRWGRE